MLTAVKNQFKISFLTIKYALMREMLNKVTFITNIIFMILNNASFIVQWIVLYSLKDNVGGYTFKQVLLLWGMAAGTYGVSRFFFKKASRAAPAATPIPDAIRNFFKASNSFSEFTKQFGHPNAENIYYYYELPTQSGEHRYLEIGTVNDTIYGATVVNEFEYIETIYNKND